MENSFYFEMNFVAGKSLQICRTATIGRRMFMQVFCKCVHCRDDVNEHHVIASAYGARDMIDTCSVTHLDL